MAESENSLEHAAHWSCCLFSSCAHTQPVGTGEMETCVDFIAITASINSLIILKDMLGLLFCYLTSRYQKAQHLKHVLGLVT